MNLNFRGGDPAPFYIDKKGGLSYGIDTKHI